MPLGHIIRGRHGPVGHEHEQMGAVGEHALVQLAARFANRDRRHNPVKPAVQIIEILLQGRVLQHLPPLSDRDSAQQQPAERRAERRIAAFDRVFRVALEFKWLLLRAISIGRRRPGLKDSTLRQYHADLERRLDRLLRRQPDKPASRRPFKAMRSDRDDLFRFVTRRDVPYTNNACERALRPSVIFRKVTGCFRSKWGAKVYAAAASVIATGRLHGFTALQAVSNALAGKPVMIPP